MNRPTGFNAMSGEMLDAMLVPRAPGLRSRRRRGGAHGGGALASAPGATFKAMAEGREFGGDTMEDKAQGLRAKMETSRWLHEMPKPTIAMVRGAAAGAGLSLAMACDLRMGERQCALRHGLRPRGYSAISAAATI